MFEQKMSSPTTTELRVTGMTCNNCARKVTEAAQKIAGVHSVSVSVANERASVRWHSAGAKNIPEILAAIAKAGFAAKEIAPEKSGEPVRQNRWQWNLILGLAVTAALMVGEWFFGLMMTDWFRWLSFATAGFVQIFCGAQFYRGAWRQIKVGQSNMDALVALGSTTAFGFSCWVLFRGVGGHIYFMEAAAIISLISFGHWIEARVSDKASGALKSLLNLAPQTARRLEYDFGLRGQAKRDPAFQFSLTPTILPKAQSPLRSAGAVQIETEVPVSELKINDRIALRPGDCVPVDGIVLEGESAVDEAMLTGESIPNDKKSGSELFAGTVNLNGRLVMRVTATGEATALAHIIAAVQRAQTSCAGIQRLGDRISNVFVPVIVAIALAAGVFWFVHSGAEKAFVIAAGVLIVACPCAMGLATPAAIMAAANAAARRGILIHDGVALEKAGKITAVIFDKTGTLTEGKPEVAAEQEFRIQNSEFRSLAAALARNSTHPISQAIANISAEQIELEDWQEIRGSGVATKAKMADGEWKMARLGSIRWLKEIGVDLAAGEKFISEWSAQGATIVGLASDKNLLGLFAVRDAVKPHAAKVVEQLHRQGLKIYLLTGDNAQTAASIAKQVGIAPKNVFAEVRPEQKAEFVKQLQARDCDAPAQSVGATPSSRGERVAFVGDGINDAPVLTQADLGIAVSRASDVAREAADIILLKSEIEAVPEALGLARATLRTIKQNLFWAFFYNALGVPLAACGVISPVFCAAAMGVSDLIVIGNALRLRSWLPYQLPLLPFVNRPGNSVPEPDSGLQRCHRRLRGL
jgi:P-type Cu+ transporter